MSEQIEGLKPWLKIKRIGRVNYGERYLYKPLGAPIVVKIAVYDADSQGPYVVVEPDNVYNNYDLETYPIPDGWYRVKENWYRPPTVGEWFLHSVTIKPAQAVASHAPHTTSRIILEKNTTKKKYLVMKFPARNDLSIGRHHLSEGSIMFGEKCVFAEVIEVEE